MWAIITDHFANRPVQRHIGLCESHDTKHNSLGCLEGILFTLFFYNFHTVKLAGQVTHQLHWAIVQMSVGKLLFFNDDILKSNFYFLWEVIGFLGALLIYKF